MMPGDDVYQDDLSIAAGDPVWRRLPSGRWTYDHNRGCVRPTSQIFRYSRDKQTGASHPMSVTLGKGLTPATALARHPAFKLVGWTAERVRSFGIGLCYELRDDEPGHGLAF